MKLKSLDEFNNERRRQHLKMNDYTPRPNGIECPACGCELFDSAPMITLASNPPQKNTICSGCGYVGYRVA